MPTNSCLRFCEEWREVKDQPHAESKVEVEIVMNYSEKRDVWGKLLITEGSLKKAGELGE